jgi:hypothetical protein
MYCEGLQPATNHGTELIPVLRSGRPATNRRATAQPEVIKGSNDGHHFTMNSSRLPSDIFVTVPETYEKAMTWKPLGAGGVQTAPRRVLQQTDGPPLQQSSHRKQLVTT